MISIDDYMVIKNVLSNNELEQVKDRYSNNLFTPIDIGGTDLYYSDLSFRVKSCIELAVSKELGRQQRTIASFARLNDETKDTSIRIHSDGNISGRRPKWASVLYLETDNESGTALFTSNTHGDRALTKDKIFNSMEDFEVWHFNPAIENSIFLYKANLFHGRYPFHCKSRRVVLVSFFN